MSDTQFTETQQFRSGGINFIYAFLLALIGLMLYGDYRQVFSGVASTHKSVPDGALIGLTLFLLVIVVLFYSTKLVTVINTEGIFYRWGPFKTSLTKFAWADIATAEVKKFDFPGWGVRYTGDGTMHNIKGNTGLHITLKSGDKLIFGTQKADELTVALKQYKTKA